MFSILLKAFINLRYYFLLGCFFIGVLESMAQTDGPENFGNWTVYRDSITGYQLRVPSPPVDSRANSNFTIKTSIDIASGSIINFGVIENPQQENPGETFIKNMSKQNPEVVKSLTTEDKDGHLVVKAILLLEENPYRLEAHELNNNLYVFGYTHTNIAFLESDVADYYFDSVKFFKPYIPENNFTLYQDSEGGFSTYFPEEFKDVSRETPNPFDKDSDPFIMYAKNAYHKPTETNYLLRYNDFPIGYYLDDEQGAIDGYLETLKAKGFTVDSRSAKIRNGLSFIELLVTFEERFKGKMEIYYRGNRMYLLFSLKDTTKGPLLEEDTFFTKFRYQPLLEVTFTNVEDSIHGIQFKIPAGYKVTPLENTDDSEIENSILYFGKNEATGGAYVVNTAQFKIYAKAGSLQAYCDSIIAYSYKEPHDTIIGKRINRIGNVPFHTYNLRSSKSNVDKIVSIGIANQQLTVLQAIVGKEEVGSTGFEAFLASVKFPKSPTFDLLTSKTPMLFKNLKSKDSVTFKLAKSALSYYAFDETDIDKMIDALKVRYMDEDEENSVKEYLISALHDAHLNAKQFDLFKDYYLDPKTEDTYKTAFMAYYSWKDDKAKEFFPLLRSLPNKAPELYLDVIVSTLETVQMDRPEIFSEVMSLLPRKDFRKAVIDRLSQKILDDSTFTNRLNPYHKELLAYFDEDLKYYKDSLTEADKFNTRYYLLFQYLNLFYTYSKEELETAKLQLDKVFDLKDTTNWLRVQLLLLYLENGMELPERILSEQLLDKYSRFELMEALIEADQISLIAPLFFQEEEFTELSVYYTILEELGIPDRLEIAGRLQHNEKQYLAYKATIGDSYYYLFTESLRANKEDFKLNDTYFDWEVQTDDWEQLGKQLLDEGTPY